MVLNHWDERMGIEHTITALKAIEELIINEAPGIMERNPAFPFGDIVGLLNYSFDYESLSLSDAILLRQVQALYSKLEPLEIGVDKEEVAYTKFLEAEDACHQTNQLFESVMRGDSYFPSALADTLFRAQAKISQILGPVPTMAQLALRLGPGATTNVQKQNASVTAKFSSPLACSGPLVPYLSEVLHELPHLYDFDDHEECGIVNVELHYGKLSFVPKNAKTYRSVVVEPVLNTMCQHGIGKHIASRLAAFGVDIRDQTLNQRLAQRGSLTGDVATLDLSSASDTISTGIVRFLLPTDWYCYLKRFASPKVTYRGHVITQSKFCSMGNGFTFPLETLIFYALAESVRVESSLPRVTSVYGDDIIVDTPRVHVLTELLHYCGFSVNLEKSYVEGPFRESCGADYLKGINIRPFYFKDCLSTERIFSFHNFLVREGRAELALQIRERFLSTDVMLFGPDGFGDGHLLGDCTLRPHGRKRGYSGYVFETYTWKPRLEYKLLPGDRVLPAYSIYVREDGVLNRGGYMSLYNHSMLGENTPSFPKWKDFTRSQRLKQVVNTLHDFALGFDDNMSEPMPVRHNRVMATLPGKARGYRRIKIYTLIPG